MSDLPSKIDVTTVLPKDCDLEAILQLVAQRSGVTLIINRGTVVIQNQTDSLGESTTNIMRDQIKQTIQDGTFYGPVAAKMEHCINIIDQQENDQRKQLLTAVQREAQALIQQLPEAQREEAADNLKLLVDSAVAKEPKRRWYEVSAQGLLDASNFVKDFTGNIAGTVGQLGKLLWSDFKLPSDSK